MGLAMHTNKAITKEIAGSYQQSPKKEKSRILDEVVRLTGYCRCYASWLLRNCGRKILTQAPAGPRIILIAELKKIERRRQSGYDEEVVKALKRLWLIMHTKNGSCFLIF